MVLNTDNSEITFKNMNNAMKQCKSQTRISVNKNT